MPPLECRPFRSEKTLQNKEKPAIIASNHEKSRLVIGHLEEFANRIAEGLEECDWHTRRQIIRTLVKQIEVGHEEVKIIYRVDPAPFAEAPVQGVLQDCGRRDFTAAFECVPARLRQDVAVMGHEGNEARALCGRLCDPVPNG